MAKTAQLKQPLSVTPVSGFTELQMSSMKRIHKHINIHQPSSPSQFHHSSLNNS